MPDCLGACLKISVARCRRAFVTPRGVSGAHIRSDLQRASNEAARQKNRAGCGSYFMTGPNPDISHLRLICGGGVQIFRLERWLARFW